MTTMTRRALMQTAAVATATAALPQIAGARDAAAAPASPFAALETAGDYELTINLSFDLQQHTTADAVREADVPEGMERYHDAWGGSPGAVAAANYGDYVLRAVRECGVVRFQLFPDFTRGLVDEAGGLVLGDPLIEARGHEVGPDPVRLLLALLAGPGVGGERS